MQIQVDLLTDVRCPFSFISQTNLQAAVENLGLPPDRSEHRFWWPKPMKITDSKGFGAKTAWNSRRDRVAVRYHPVFLNPAQQAESLSDYLWREFGHTRAYFESSEYPLRRLAQAAGIELSSERLVVNTFDAHCLIAAAQEQEAQHALVPLLSRWYFEEARDISEDEVLVAAAEAVGLEGKRTLERARELRETVQQRYEDGTRLRVTTGHLKGISIHLHQYIDIFPNNRVHPRKLRAHFALVTKLKAVFAPDWGSWSGISSS